MHRALGRSAAAAASAFQQGKLTASDGVAGDSAGWSVAISGSTAVVGAYQRNSGAGAAYVFVRSGSAWSQQAELTASDGAANDQFGYSVAVSGSTAVVGAIGHSGTGAAYVFVRSGSAWSQQAELTASDGNALGWSVAISGSTVLVGSPDSNSGVGAAYVFIRASGQWSQQAELTAPGSDSNEPFFGVSVAVSGSTAVVGANGDNANAGLTFVFVRSGTAWSQQAELTASDAGMGHDFGWSVALTGATLVVGAPGNNSAYVFVRSGTAWSQQAELTSSGVGGGDDFGLSVAVSGSTVLVGAPFNNFSTGAAYMFVASGTGWSQRAELTASDGTFNDNFGFSVALSGSQAAVGAYANNSDTGAAYPFALPFQQGELTGATNDNFGYSVAISGSTAVVGAPFGNSFDGAAYVFARVNGVWSQQAELTPADAASGDEFGYSVAISGPTVVVGAFEKNSATGAAYVFTRSGTVWSEQAELTAPDGVSGDFFGNSVAISGSTAVVGAYSRNSGTGAAYVFVSSGTVWSQQAELTAPDGATNDHFGAGVAISGSTAVIGAYGHNTVGAAYVFLRSGTAWSQQAELNDGDQGTFDDFGTTVAISGSTVVVGALHVNSFTGEVYVFVRARGAWSQQAALTASDGASGDAFGDSVSISGSTILVGAEGHNSNAGTAYVFTRSGTAWSQQAELTAADAASNHYFGFSVALSGHTAFVGSTNPITNNGTAYAFANV